MFHEKIVKLLSLTNSSNDHECLSAIRKANEIVSKNGLTWEVLILTDQPPPTRPMDSSYPDIQEMIDIIHATVDEDFDMTFLNSVERQYKRKGRLSDNQIRALQNIYDNWVDV